LPILYWTFALSDLSDAVNLKKPIQHLHTLSVPTAGEDLQQGLVFPGTLVAFVHTQAAGIRHGCGQLVGVFYVKIQGRSESTVDQVYLTLNVSVYCRRCA
jgi:hypothetical protein